MRTSTTLRTALFLAPLLLATAAGTARAQEALEKVPRQEQASTPAKPTRPCPTGGCCDRCSALGMDCEQKASGRCECCTGSADKGFWCGAPTDILMVRWGFACSEDVESVASHPSIRSDPCGAAGTWTVSCEPEPVPGSCPLAAQVPAGTLSAAGVVSAAVAAAGGSITLTATSGPGVGRLNVTGVFDPHTCTATFRTSSPQCGEGASSYVLRDGAIRGSRKGGTKCCSAVRRCTGAVQR